MNMKTILSISELLAKLKIYKKEIESKYNEYLNPESEEAKHSKLLMTLYYDDRNVTIRGIPTEDYRKDIQSMYDSINSAVSNYTKLMMVKNAVNSTCKLTIPSLDTGKEVEMTIDQILTLKSPSIKNYYFGIINKLKSDKELVYSALHNHEETAMSTENINRYVNAKLNSLNMSNDYDSMSANYAKFAQEYKDANKISIFDPLNLLDKMENYESRIIDFYNTIDYKLLEFNSITKVWIDFDLEEDFWGFY